MKKYRIYLTLGVVSSILINITSLSTPAHADNTLEKILCRKATLRGNNRPVMVNRFTGEVESIQREDGTWAALEGQWKEQYQKMYDAQDKPNRPAIQDDDDAERT